MSTSADSRLIVRCIGTRAGEAFLPFSFLPSLLMRVNLKSRFSFRKTLSSRESNSSLKNFHFVKMAEEQ